MAFKDSQSVPSYLGITRDITKEAFDRLQPKGKDRQPTDGWFVNHPIAHARI